jgi:hypothetical protein
MVAQSRIDLAAFGPFAQMFEAYFGGMQSLSQGFGVQAGDVQAMGSQVSGPAKALARCQLEAMGLVNRRAQAYMDIPSRMARCKTPQDLIAEQMAFWRTAAEQYTESSQKIAEAWGQMLLLPAGFGSAGADGRRERDYIAFPSAKDANGEGGAASARERQRRVA